MNRLEVEVQAPWALNYYDAGVKSGKVGPAQATFSFANQWMDINDHVPEIDQEVLYYFESTGVSLGVYNGVDDQNPDFGNCGHVFSSRDGFLTGDVTHWMPAPEAPNTA